jgi:hypothetical protein
MGDHAAAGAAWRRHGVAMLDRRLAGEVNLEAVRDALA